MNVPVPKRRRLGLTRDAHSGPSLHKNAHDSRNSPPLPKIKPSPLPDVAVNAPPLESSSESDDSQLHQTPDNEPDGYLPELPGLRRMQTFEKHRQRETKSNSSYTREPKGSYAKTNKIVRDGLPLRDISPKRKKETTYAAGKYRNIHGSKAPIHDKKNRTQSEGNKQGRGITEKKNILKRIDDSKSTAILNALPQQNGFKQPPKLPEAGSTAASEDKSGFRLLLTVPTKPDSKLPFKHPADRNLSIYSKASTESTLQKPASGFKVPPQPQEARSIGNGDSRRRSTRMNGSYNSGEWSSKASKETLQQPQYIAKAIGADNIYADATPSSQDSSTSTLSAPSSPLSSTGTLSPPLSFEPASSNSSVSADSPTTKCPVCTNVVPSSLLRSFKVEHALTHRRFTFNYQTLFHRTHLTAEAHSTWESRHYPSIDWSSLPSRLPQYEPRLAAIVDGTIPSYYRARIAATQSTRRDRTVTKAVATGEDDGKFLGYYGSHGSGVISRWILDIFKDRLRAITTTDPLIRTAGGILEFVHAVLVPELAACLVAEDVKACPKMKEGVRERARERLREDIRGGDPWSFDLKGKQAEEQTVRWILEESADVGRLLSVEEDDFVERGEESGEDGDDLADW